MTVVGAECGLDRLLAQAIVTLAQTYQAGSIVLPKLGDMRELVESEIQARAEQKIPGYIEGQEKYAKQYRVNIHQWSYGRLMDTRTYAEPLHVAWAVPGLLPGIVLKPEFCVSPGHYQSSSLKSRHCH